MKVAVVVSSGFEDGADFVANIRALEAAGAEVVVVDGDGPDAWAVAGAVCAVTHRVQIATRDAAADTALGTLSRGRMLTGEPDWPRVDLPPTRDGWARLLRDQETAGAAGIVVPWDPRLIDLLRNPEADDRSDLLMSTG